MYRAAMVCVDGFGTQGSRDVLGVVLEDCHGAGFEARFTMDASTGSRRLRYIPDLEQLSWWYGRLTNYWRYGSLPHDPPNVGPYFAWNLPTPREWIARRVGHDYSWDGGYLLRPDANFDDFYYTAVRGGDLRDMLPWGLTNEEIARNWPSKGSMFDRAHGLVDDGHREGLAAPGQFIREPTHEHLRATIDMLLGGVVGYGFADGKPVPIRAVTRLVDVLGRDDDRLESATDPPPAAEPWVPTPVPSGSMVRVPHRRAAKQRPFVAEGLSRRLVPTRGYRWVVDGEAGEGFAEQVLHAFYELVRGFQAAHDASGDRLLARRLEDEPDEIHQGLVTVVLRLAYLLYAEETDPGLLDVAIRGGYSVCSLYERLRTDASLFPDTMDHRFGAYSQLLDLWRMVHDAVRTRRIRLPGGWGDLFDPHRYPFLEGRRSRTRRTRRGIEPPRVEDATVHRVLERLMYFDSERVYYKVSEGGEPVSVWAPLFGLRLKKASGHSIAIRAAGEHRAAVTVNLEALLGEEPDVRAGWLRDRTGHELPAAVSGAVREAGTVNDLCSALEPVIDRKATPHLVPPGSVVLHPTAACRRSESYYTPRQITELVVRTALEPILAHLAGEAGSTPSPEQILNVKVGDLAMGSGEFLAEACCQLADALVVAWRAHDATPDVAPSMAEAVFARRLVAQRCIYGVDSNPEAVHRAKVSIQHAASASGHSNVCVDHGLRQGDSLVGETLVGRDSTYGRWIDDPRNADPPATPFDWSTQFPEVFDQDPPGFDAIVGDLPSWDHTSMEEPQAASYNKWLRRTHTGSPGRCDVAAHFLRRAYDLIRPSGTIGLATPETIAKGTTRANGLCWICENGGEIYNTRRHVRRPGDAYEVGNIVHIAKGPYKGLKHLDGEPVEEITAYLLHQGGHGTPARLVTLDGRSIKSGADMGMGFTVGDREWHEDRTLPQHLDHLIERYPHYEDVIYPYIEAEDFNTSPTQSHHRFILNFGNRTEHECRTRYPDLVDILENHVKPEWLTPRPTGGTTRARRSPIWWQQYQRAKDTYSNVSDLTRVLATDGTSTYTAFAFLPPSIIHADPLIVFPIDTYAGFAVIQARPHEIWARFFGPQTRRRNQQESQQRYGFKNCFETFPLPTGYEAQIDLETAGQKYYEFRKTLMLRNNAGVPDIYDRFHDPHEDSPQIAQLRRLHTNMDRAVLNAYSWSDLSPDCEFLPDYDTDHETWDSPSKPCRYRWPDVTRDEVLARLLELNAKSN